MPDKVDFTELGVELKTFETALLVSATRENEQTPHTSNVPVHLSFVNMDETSTHIQGDTIISTSATNIKGVLHFGLDIILDNRDSVVVEQLDGTGNVLATYRGRIGTPVVYRSRKRCVFDILDVQQGHVPQPGIVYQDAKVTDFVWNDPIWKAGYTGAYVDGVMLFGKNFETKAIADDYGNPEYLVGQITENEPNYGWVIVTIETALKLLPDETVYTVIETPQEIDGVWQARVGIDTDIEVFNEIRWEWYENKSPIPLTEDSTKAQSELSYFSVYATVDIDDYGNPVYGYLNMPIVAGMIIRRKSNPDVFHRVKTVTRIQRYSTYTQRYPRPLLSWYQMELETIEWPWEW